MDTCASIKYPMDIQSLGNLSNVYLPGHPKHPGTRANTTEGDESVAAGKARITAAEGSKEEVNEKLVEAIMDYDGEKAIEWTKIGLERGMSAQEIVFDGLSFGMKIVGDMYERNERFVTDMLKAAKTMDKAMPVLTPILESSGSADGPTGTVVVGLVRGNTQDIGKNLVCLMLKANGFKVIDLGKNVKPEQFVATAEEHNAVAIGMSVMTNSSAVYVEKTVELLNSQGKGDKYLLMTGGAAINRMNAEQMGTHYGSDANAAVSLVKAHITSSAA
jgi:methanogenic corrinoid protein MtbC1